MEPTTRPSAVSPPPPAGDDVGRDAPPVAETQLATLRSRIRQLEAELEAARRGAAARPAHGGSPNGSTFPPPDAAEEGIDRFRQLVESVQHYGVAMLDQEGRIIDCNAEMLAIYGAPDRSALVGRHVSCFYTPEQIAAGDPQRSLDAAASAGQVEEEVQRVRANGERFWALAMIHGLRDRGALRGFAKVIRDITERKRDEERAQLMIDLALNAMVLVNSRGEITYMNPQTEKMFGYASEELIGQPIEVLVAERLRPLHQASRRKFFHDPAVRAMGAGRDLHGRRKDGSEFPIEVGLNPMQTDEGMIVVASVLDITQRKRAEERFRLAVESAPSAMVMVNGDGLIVLVNLQTEKLFGYPREMLLGQPIELLVPDRFRVRHPEYVRHFFERPAPRPMGASRDLRGRRRDGSEFAAEIGLTPIETDDGLFVLSAVVDITERKQIEERSRRHLAEMAHAGRLITVGEMFSSLAHEINQPLAAAANYARACVRFAQSEQGVPQAQLVELMEKAAAQAARATEIVKRVGTFVRRDRSTHVALDLNGLIEHVLSLPIVDLPPGERGQRFAPQVELEPALPPVMADRVQIEQVLVNLVRNALDAMRDVPAHERRLVLRTARAGDDVQASVADAGSGIAAEHMDHLFDPFFTTKEDGMGLGLSISRSIIEAHGGRLTVERNAHRGVTFRFFLPRAHEEARS